MGMGGARGRRGCACFSSAGWPVRKGGCELHCNDYARLAAAVRCIVWCIACCVHAAAWRLGMLRQLHVQGREFNG